MGKSTYIGASTTFVRAAGFAVEEVVVNDKAVKTTTVSQAEKVESNTTKVIVEPVTVTPATDVTKKESKKNGKPKHQHRRNHASSFRVHAYPA
jgi:hypothetical protein